MTKARLDLPHDEFFFLILATNPARWRGVLHHDQVSVRLFFQVRLPMTTTIRICAEGW
jgi:hypothetical protein